MRRGTFFVFKKIFILDKIKWPSASFQYISIALNLTYNKKKLYKTLDCWLRDLLKFDFFEKGLGIVTPPDFVHDFSRKLFLTNVLLTDQISLFACFYFLKYWAIYILQLFINLAVTL